MRYSILLLCIVLGVFAFVDAQVVERRSELLKHRHGKRGTRQCTSKSKSPAAGSPPAAASSSPSDSVANSNKAVSQGRGGGAGGGGGKGGKGGAPAPSNGTGTGTNGTPANNNAAAATTTAALADSGKTNTGTGNTSTGTGNNGTGTGNTGTGNTGGTGNTAVTCLQADAIQTGSDNTGSSALEAGQSLSATDPANFINFCAGKTLTNGTQITTGSCNGIPSGEIPAVTQMASSMILVPGHNQDLPVNTTFNITSKLNNVEAGFFSSAAVTYYSAPTQLNPQGLPKGHTHVTVQNLGNSFNPNAPLEASTFAFFLGINSPPDANGELQAQVVNGLPEGFYRVCTMVSNENHSPLQMPIARRGGQDDCKYFSVGKGGGSTNPNDATSTNVAAGSNQQTTNTNTSATTAGAPAPAPAPASTNTTTGAGGKGAKTGGKTGGKNVGKGGRR